MTPNRASRKSLFSLVTAQLYELRQRFHDATLRTNGLNTAYGVFEQTYQVAQNGYAFDTPEAWEIANVTHYRA